MRGLRCSQQVVASLTSAASVQKLKANTASAPTVASCVVVVNAIAVVVVVSVACANISVAVVDLHGREGGDEAFVVEVFAEVVGGNDDVLACVKVRVLSSLGTAWPKGARVNLGVVIACLAEWLVSSTMGGEGRWHAGVRPTSHSKMS